MLFEKAEQMLNGEAPQVHAARVLRSDTFRASPKQPDWTFVTRRAIVFQEFHKDHRAGSATREAERRITSAKRVRSSWSVRAKALPHRWKSDESDLGRASPADWVGGAGGRERRVS